MVCCRRACEGLQERLATAAMLGILDAQGRFVAATPASANAAHAGSSSQSALRSLPGSALHRRVISMSSELERLLDSLPQLGRVEWIGVRPARVVAMQSVQAVQADVGRGLLGDRFKGTATSRRQVTLIQAEHLAVLAALLGEAAPIDAARLRRNIVVSGINLLALQRSRFSIGAVVLEGTGGCHPCSRMESELGPGGFNAMRGHGGITARVITAGAIHVHDAVRLLQSGDLSPDEK